MPQFNINDEVKITESCTLDECRGKSGEVIDIISNNRFLYAVYTENGAFYHEAKCLKKAEELNHD